ncbi:hypothetical protein [Mesorhizobium sp. CN2-181]|uniref:hypothetical protein n=1 Tax=Mesorhizobium yinganensis TaxID=3157707 RepID=UPI0032B83752
MADRVAMEQEARQRVLAYDIRARLDRGERVTLDEFAAMARVEDHDLGRKLFEDIRELSDRRALMSVAGAITGYISAYRISQYERRIELEDRIATLEARLAERDAQPRIIAGRPRLIAGGKGR